MKEQRINRRSSWLRWSARPKVAIRAMLMLLLAGCSEPCLQTITVTVPDGRLTSADTVDSHNHFPTFTCLDLCPQRDGVGLLRCSPASPDGGTTRIDCLYESAPDCPDGVDGFQP
jgi:hypothetical protein